MARTLLSAVKSGNVVLTKTILSKRLYGNIDSQDPRQDGTALFWACSNGLIEIVHLLIFHGANLEACTAWHATPLHACADNNQLDIARSVYLFYLIYIFHFILFIYLFIYLFI